MDLNAEAALIISNNANEPDMVVMRATNAIAAAAREGRMSVDFVSETPEVFQYLKKTLGAVGFVVHEDRIRWGDPYGRKNKEYQESFFTEEELVDRERSGLMKRPKLTNEE